MVVVGILEDTAHTFPRFLACIFWSYLERGLSTVAMISSLQQKADEGSLLRRVLWRKMNIGGT